MKAIHSCQTVVDGENITITGKLVDITFPDVLSQRHTIMHPVNGSKVKPRHVQATTHGIVLKRHGSEGFLFPKDEIASVAAVVDSTLTDAPVFIKHPSEDSLVGTIASETPVAVTLQKSTDGKAWEDVLNATKDLKPDCKTHYRAIAKNATGETVSQSLLTK